MDMGRNSFENIFVNIDLLVYMMVVGLVSGGALSARIAWPFIFPPVMLEGFTPHHSCLLLLWLVAIVVGVLWCLLTVGVCLYPSWCCLASFRCILNVCEQFLEKYLLKSFAWCSVQLFRFDVLSWVFFLNGYSYTWWCGVFSLSMIFSFGWSCPLLYGFRFWQSHLPVSLGHFYYCYYTLCRVAVQAHLTQFPSLTFPFINFILQL